MDHANLLRKRRHFCRSMGSSHAFTDFEQAQRISCVTSAPQAALTCHTVSTGVLDSAPHLTSLRMRIDTPDATDSRDFRVINSSVLHRLPSLAELQHVDVTVPCRDDGSARAGAVPVHLH